MVDREQTILAGPPRKDMAEILLHDMRYMLLVCFAI
jgi:hypothetical protein